jgi:nucleoside-diphosphate-sugar epimerase
MKPIAVIGAGGYVGARLIEMSVLRGGPPIVPIVRSWRSQGRLARFGVQTVTGDASSAESLIPLLKGCGMVVNLTMGDNARMVSDVQAMHYACRVAGVPVLVHMSSAEVFGRAETPGLREDSVPDARHWMEYARAKAAADSWLRSQFDGPVKVVILRPGLIWGPGSGWLAQPAQLLADGTAYLFNEGRGICNLIHVDNLIQHLEQLARAGATDSAVFNVSDPEELTWSDYYGAIAKEIGVAESTIRVLPDTAFRDSALDKVLAITQIAPAKAIKNRLADATKVRVRQQIMDRIHPPIREAEPSRPRVATTKILWWLQGVERKLPSGAFARAYPETHLRSFYELMPAAGEWLRFAGFAAEEGTTQ